jgi:predicted nucleic acid-binding protein
MSTFIDANVLLEMLLEGRRKPDAARKAIARTDQAVISPLVVHLYTHFGKKEKHPLPDLLEDLESYTIIPMAATHVAWAVANRQDDDFEDALQVACAVLHGCKMFVTFDAGLAKNYDKFIRIKLL